jgi:hypothetical protein
LRAQTGLKGCHLLADSGLSKTEFTGGLREAAAIDGANEHLQGREAIHNAFLMGMPVCSASPDFASAPWPRAEILAARLFR